MKLSIAFFVLAFFLSFASAEIEARFPGVQPIAVPGLSTVEVDDDDGQVTIENKLVIDDFSQNTSPPVIVTLPEGNSSPVTGTSFDRDSGIIGGERDVILTATDGIPALVFSAGATGGAFTVATPNSGSGFARLQYDGTDASETLDIASGLQGIDFTANGGVGLRVVASSDVRSSFTVLIADSNGRSGSISRDVPAGDEFNNYFFDFSDFPGSVNFASINALQFEIDAFDNVDFEISTVVTYGPVVVVSSGDCITGVTLPCDTDYYRLIPFENVQPEDYLYISYNDAGETDQPGTTGRFFVVSSEFENLQQELASNENIVDTLGNLPGPYNFEYSCSGDCEIEIAYNQLKNATYYFAVESHGTGNLVYEICMAYRDTSIFALQSGVSQTVFFDQRPTTPPADNILHYRYYSLDIPETSFSEGTYLVVNISRVEPFPGLGLHLMYQALPEAAVDTGVIGEIDFDSQGNRVDDMIYPFCVDLSDPNRPPYDNPVNSDPRVPCSCFSEIQLFGDGPAFQLTCQLVVDPCQFQYGRWYMSVELPEREQPANSLDTTGQANYTITATAVQPSITTLIRNVTFKAFVEPEAVAHFKIDVPADTVVDDETHLFVHLSNVRNGIVDMYVHRGLGIGSNLAGIDGCAPANVTCRTCDACNVVFEKCHFSPGTYYISVNIVYDDETEAFLFDDEDQLPVTFTLRANWLQDAAPRNLVAGVPVSSSIGEALYDFYVIDVPPTIDTWLFVELFAKANDTEVILSILHGEIPGGECYARPDFHCLTGDPSGMRYSSGTPAFLDNDPVQRESCSFMIQTCELTAGPLYLSVYGHHKDYAAYGDNTFYQVPVQYTLWADFDVALAIQSGVSYSEVVSEHQYQHYYIRADQIQQGSSLTVEVTNIRHGIPSSLEAFVNYNYLAGTCPCYDHLYNCTGAQACPNAMVSDDSVITCCTIVVPASDFRPGVWYIAVLGVYEDLFSYTTPVGYTLTATINDAPDFTPLILGQTYQGEVPQWNTTYEYANFRLAADAIPLNDLVVKTTFVQNCDYKGKHDDTNDSLWVFLNKGAPATHYLGGWEYRCKVDTTTDSYCTIVVPHCEWEGDDWFVAVQGNYDADFVGRITVRASTDAVRDYRLTDGVSRYDRVAESRYNHYFITTTAEEDQYLSIDLYTNQDQDKVTAYLMKDQRAGDEPCFRHFASCETESCCSWQLHACDLEPGRYYISVYGHSSQFYDTSVEYTLTAGMKPVSTLLFNGDPFTGHLKQVGDVQHYRFQVPTTVSPGSYLSFNVDNVKHGAVTVYSQYGYLAGRCPCFTWERTCTAAGAGCGEDEDSSDWCRIRVPTCELVPGEYFFSVWAIESNTPATAVFNTPIGYTIEAQIITPVVVDPFVALGRDTANTEPFQFVANERYNHYEFSVDDDDFNNGYHIIVEITSVRDGALFVYYNQFAPADSESGCHVAELCTSGLGAGSECHWQIPYCLAKPLGTDNKHYISVEGRTGRNQASYNILIYKQGVPSYVQNPSFTLDNGSDNGIPGSRLDITHFAQNEPNGWTQFIRLTDVPARLDEGRGEMLEVFFYRISNNVDQPMSFNVYLHPNEPAGAHECCDQTDAAALGSCQGAPCSNTADVTTSANNGPAVFSHTCTLGNGIGHDGNDDPLFGERCTVRVWPCEFNKYCGDETTDWFMSVVPVAPTDLSSVTSGAGLQYSTQWRVRDTRLAEPSLVGSIDLDSSINTGEFTRTYSVSTDTTEDGGWLSFFVNFPASDNARLSIQTEFISGSGTVYINGGEFASGSPTCHTYQCSSDMDCSGDDRFYVSECCAVKYDRYYITLRNTGAVGSSVSVQFRITEVTIPEPVQIDSHPSVQFPFTSSSTGVEGDNYDYYILTIDDDDLDRDQTWVVDAEYVGTHAGSLNVFIRFGAAPGQYSNPDSAEIFGDDIEGCHGWQYLCSMSVGERCLWQIPSCSLIEGHWWIGIQNPDFDFVTPSSLPQYQLTTYISNPPTFIDLDEQVSSPSNDDSGLLQHYSLNITADELDFDSRDEFTGFWTKWLRIQFDNVSGGSLTAYFQYGAVAGDRDDGSLCYNSFTQLQCDSTSCFQDFLPCDSTFITGDYHIAVRHDAGTSYSLSARVYRNDYSEIQLSETIVGSGNRLGAVDRLYSHTSTTTELNENGDGEGNYRYVINVESGTDDDDMFDNEYLIFNFTSSSFTQNNDAVVRYEVFRDDCTRYECETIGPNSWCTVDALELAPCSAKAGRYFIRVENSFAVPFTVNLYRNETVVQNIQNAQTITEVVYPYEYQEYFYNAADVGEGSTLSVQICSICGDVEAFIKPNTPAGPTPDVSFIANSCSMDHCNVTGPVDTDFNPENNCCTLFLDTCQFKQTGYYIGVRGVTTVYPNAANPNLYLPAKYTIQPVQTPINITDISPSCSNEVEYCTAGGVNVPRQFAVDIETVNVGAMLKFSLRLPEEYATSGDMARIYAAANRTVGYSDGCPTDEVLQCSTNTACSFVVPFCKLQPYCGGRYYIWADAPRGSEVIVERYDPYVPVIKNDITYHSTINHPSTSPFDLPWTPSHQIYRFDLDAKLYEDPNYYEKFFVRVILSQVTHGEVSFAVNSGYTPYVAETGCGSPMFLDTTACQSIADGEECWVELQYSDLFALAGQNEHNIPSTFWITVFGLQQECELHSIKYAITVQTHWVLTYYPLNETICNTVEQQQYNFHRLRPRAVENPQESILRIRISDLDEDESVELLARDHYLASSLTDDNTYRAASGLGGSIDVNYICGYDDLYLSVYGSTASDDEIDYKMSVEKVHVPVKELFDDSIYYADDDDDDACPHPHDFYRFRTVHPNGHHPGSFLRVLVDSEFPTRVYVNKNDFAWEGCADSGYGENDPALTGTTSVNVYDFCEFADGDYFITVVSDGPYYIYTHIRDDAKELTIGEVFRDELEPGMYQMYTLDICDEWTEADDRLVVEISDVAYGDVSGWIRHNGNAGDPTEYGYNTCSESHAFADYGASESGYDFMLINHCSLKTGTYYILVRAANHPGSPERNCEHVTFRLFPYLIDYQIDPISLTPNTMISGEISSGINRIVPGATKEANYYVVHPLTEGEGYYEQVSHAVVRIANVDHGSLRVGVMCGHLAIEEFARIDGEVYGLVEASADDGDEEFIVHSGLNNPEWKMQSGRYPFRVQNVMDHRDSPYQEGCTGCQDFCDTMTLDDIDIYNQDNSLAIWIPSCYWIWADFYIVVSGDSQFTLDNAITYDITVEQYRDYHLLPPNHNSVRSFEDDNWDYDFFYSISAEPESMRWRVVVTQGEGVLVTVRNHRCPRQATWSKQIWCDAAYFDRPWMCDIEIPTRAAHPGDNAYFVAVNGKNATYSIAFWRGRENCHAFSGSGRNEGLDFCAGLVPYNTWRWDGYAHLDHEAECFFEQLYSHFRVQPCYTGVTPECNSTLQAFACYESFRRCDEQGFYTGTCRDTCETVVYECANHFETVDLEYYNCSSSRYIDSNAGTCTGHSKYAPENGLFLGDEPNLLLFKSSPSSSGAATLSVSLFFVVLIALIF